MKFKGNLMEHGDLYLDISSIPSEEQKAMENGHRNSGFSWIFPLKMVIFHCFLYVHQRVIPMEVEFEPLHIMTSKLMRPPKSSTQAMAISTGWDVACLITILKNISQWEGLSHILWKINMFETTNQIKYDQIRLNRCNSMKTIWLTPPSLAPRRALSARPHHATWHGNCTRNWRTWQVQFQFQWGNN